MWRCSNPTCGMWLSPHASKDELKLWRFGPPARPTHECFPGLPTWEADWFGDGPAPAYPENHAMMHDGPVSAGGWFCRPPTLSTAVRAYLRLVGREHLGDLDPSELAACESERDAVWQGMSRADRDLVNEIIEAAFGEFL